MLFVPAASCPWMIRRRAWLPKPCRHWVIWVRQLICYRTSTILFPSRHSQSFRLRTDVVLDFTRSPSSRAVAPPVQQNQWRQTTSPQSPQDEPEPLLSLLTASHPWVGNTINGSLSAYETTKYYSPAFVRSSAEFVERAIGSPLSNTVGSISRRTGVEAGVRRYLGQRRSSDTES